MKRIELCDHVGDAIGTLTILPSPSLLRLPSKAVGAQECKWVLDVVRSLPPEFGTVLLQLPRLGAINMINKRVTTMDIFSSLVEQKAAQKSELPMRLIAPAATLLPEDNMLEYVAIEEVSQLTSAHKPNTVFMFSEEARPVMKCLIEFRELFGCVPTVLVGAPGVTYDSDFESATWDCQRVAYHSMINDLVEANRRATDMATETKSVSQYNKETSAYTKKNGDVKRFNAFDLNGAKPASEEQEATADEPNS